MEGRNFDTTNPYISFSVNEKKYKTKIAKKGSNPKWNETFSLYVMRGVKRGVMRRSDEEGSEERSEERSEREE